MSKLLVTGASGFLGGILIKKMLEQGYKIYALSRHPPAPAENLIPLAGDITEPGLGLEEVPKDIAAVIHSAALLSFKARDRDRLYQTNWQGTVNLLEWMGKHRVTRLFHLSTAYLFDHNDYETSKRMAEEAIQNYPEIKTTIVRPSIIIGDTNVEGIPPLSGFYMGVAAIDRAKRWFEQKSGLPPLRTQIRISGVPAARLDLIPVDVVVENIARIIVEDKTGTFQFTHPNPPTLELLEHPISQAIGADIKFVPEFKPNLLERVIAMSLKELFPYLEGCDLPPSNIQCLPLDNAFVEKSIRVFLKS